MTMSDSSKVLARAAADVVRGSGRPRVLQMLDAQEKHSVDVMTIADAPARGLSTFSTVTLHETVNLLDGEDLRVELLAVAMSDVDCVDNLLAHAALNVLKDAWLAAPGVVYPGLVAEYDLSDSLPHLLLTAPIPFPDLGSLEVPGLPPVHWLLCMAISESERLYLIDKGLDAFEQLLEQADADYWSFNRPAVV